MSGMGKRFSRTERTVKCRDSTGGEPESIQNRSEDAGKVWIRIQIDRTAYLIERIGGFLYITEKDSGRESLLGKRPVFCWECERFIKRFGNTF